MIDGGLRYGRGYSKIEREAAAAREDRRDGYGDGTVVAAAETGSFSKAAEALSYTPSGVNQLVTALEKEFGFPLFRRNTKGVALTENGELLLPVIRKFLRQEDRIFELSAEMNGLLIGSVNIAAYSSIATHWLPAVIGAFQRDYPQIHINLLEGIWQEVSQWLDDRVADIGFFSYQENMPYEWIPLAEDPMLALLPRDHPLAGAAVYPLANCATDRFIMPAKGCDDDVTALFHRTGIVPNVQFTTIESFSAMSMVEQGLGMSVMNKLITEKRVCDIAMLPVDPPASIMLGIALHSRADLSPAVRMFLKYAVRMLTKHEKSEKRRPTP